MHMQVVMVRNIAKGEFVKRKADSKKVYVRGDYCRASKAYVLQDWNDISRAIYVKASKPLFIGFDF